MKAGVDMRQRRQRRQRRQGRRLTAVPSFRLSVLVGGALLSALIAAPAGAQSLTEAQQMVRVGEYDDAIRAYMRIARREESPAAGRGLVRTLMEVGRHDDAIREGRRFNESQTPQLSNVLGEALYRRGNIADAETAYRAAIAGASDSLVARVNLAILRYERGEVDAAMQEFDYFIDVYNSRPSLSAEELEAVATAGQYLGERNFSLSRDALRVYDEAAAANPADLDPRIRVGELFFAKYENTDATSTFREILEINPEQPRALLGMARSMHFDRLPEAMETVRKSLDVNSNSVPARLFLARLYIELEQYEQAAEETNRAMEVNASSPEIWAMTAAIRYFRGDDTSFASAVRRTLELNPRYANLFNTLAELSARNRLYQNAVDFANQALALDSLSWRGYGLLGMNQLRTGAIEEGRRNLENSFALAPFDLWTKNTLDLLDTFSNYVSSESKYFELVMHRDESPLLRLYLADVADQAYEQLADRYGARPETPIRLEVYPRHADFSVRTVGLAGLGALGVSFGRVLAMDSPSARGVGQFHWASTLWHEVAHSFHMTISEYRVPRWFTEGLAVFEERRAREGWGDDVSVAFLMAYMENKLHPVSQLNNGFVRPSYPQQVVFSYYLASLVCEFIQRDWGDPALVDMLRAYGAGQNSAQAFETVLDMEAKEFDQAFDRYMKERFTGALTALQSPHTEELQSGNMDIQTLLGTASRSENDFSVQLATGQALVRAERYEEAISHLTRAKELFPEYAGGDSPYWFLAMAYKAQRMPDRAAAELADLTAINAGHYYAYLEQAELLEAVGNPAGAAVALDRAQYVYPFDMDIHRRLGDLYEGLGEWPGVIRERQAVLALDPVDRAEAEYQLALAYFESGDLRQARRSILRALERAPNFEKALELLLEIRSRRNGAERF
ncbi:MAG: tetratricopeptide repeat protein [Gemmatimonadales bacterium]